MKLREPEFAEQAALIYWVRQRETKHPELRLLMAIPAGRKRSMREAIKLKAEGVLPGFPDLFLSVARQGFHGLFIEMKGPGRKSEVTKDQRAWHDALLAEGYAVTVQDTWQAAWNLLVWYLGLSVGLSIEVPITTKRKHRRLSA